MIGWLVVGGFALVAWLWLTVAQGWFWRTDQRLPAGSPPARWPSVAVVVPARDEVEVLPASLPSLLAQRYPGPVRLILVDDNSTDGTGELAEKLAIDAAVPLTVSTPGEPPAGWTGKLWAVEHGVGIADDADFLLLTDADIRHGPESLTRMVESATAGGFDLVSQMALLRTETVWERLIVPAFVYFFAMIFPFRRVNRPGSRVAAAAGGCMLVRADTLRRAGGVAAIGGAVIDDVALAGLVKRAGGRLWLGLAEDVHSVRPYPRLADLWQMVARSAYTQLRHSPLLLVGTVVGLGVVFLVPPVTTVVGAADGDLIGCGLGAVTWLLMAATFAPMLRYYRQPVAAALLLPVTATLYLLMTVDSARRHWSGRGAAWKGRNYVGPAGHPARHE
ncbi:MAG TPA: glycosyltransferase [Pseudonocardiaceae bacterium]|jgi:hopene-associated glycosyltransferase HpnB|nr:glycosyltransferase [Pseudonocardiaceae bacterium]